MDTVLPVVAAMAVRPAEQPEDHGADDDELDHGLFSLKVEVAVSSHVTFGSRHEVGHDP